MMRDASGECRIICLKRVCDQLGQIRTHVGTPDPLGNDESVLIASPSCALGPAAVSFPDFDQQPFP